jgi:hypothetical protein
MSIPARPPALHVPTLTEVIDLQPDAAVAPQTPRTPPIRLDTLPVLGDVLSEPVASVPPSQAAPEPMPGFSEAQLAHRVLADVQKQVDSMLEFRLREAMGPVLARHTEAIARDLRDELSRTLRDVVARSVAQELAKLRQR